jgi:hypothetical protein
MLITCSFGKANAGADVRYAVLESDGSVHQARTATGVTELLAGSGVYGVTVADSILAGRTVLWDIDGTTKAAGEAFPDIQSMQARILGMNPSTVVVQNPVAASGNLSIRQGDSYHAVDGRALAWTRAGWLDLSEWTVQFMLQNETYGASVTVAGDEQTVTVELTHSQTASLMALSSPFSLRAVKLTGEEIDDEVTLLKGIAVVDDDV